MRKLFVAYMPIWDLQPERTTNLLGKKITQGKDGQKASSHFVFFSITLVFLRLLYTTPIFEINF